MTLPSSLVFLKRASQQVRSVIKLLRLSRKTSNHTKFIIQSLEAVSFIVLLGRTIDSGTRALFWAAFLTESRGLFTLAVGGAVKPR